MIRHAARLTRWAWADALGRSFEAREDSPSALGQRSGPALKTLTLPADGKVSQASQFLKRALCKVVRERARRRSRVQPPGQNPPISVACNACVNEQNPGGCPMLRVTLEVTLRRFLRRLVGSKSDEDQGASHQRGRAARRSSRLLHYEGTMSATSRPSRASRPPMFRLRRREPRTEISRLLPSIESVHDGAGSQKSMPCVYAHPVPGGCSRHEASSGGTWERVAGSSNDRALVGRRLHHRARNSYMPRRSAEN